MANEYFGYLAEVSATLAVLKQQYTPAPASLSKAITDWPGAVMPRLTSIPADVQSLGENVSALLADAATQLAALMSPTPAPLAAAGLLDDTQNAARQLRTISAAVSPIVTSLNDMADLIRDLLANSGISDQDLYLLLNDVSNIAEPWLQLQSSLGIAIQEMNYLEESAKVANYQAVTFGLNRGTASWSDALTMATALTPPA